MAPAPSPVLVVIGPSGSGKSSVVRLLARRGVLRIHPTWTTRPRRDDERCGSPEHRFVSDTAFDGLEAAGAFLDTVTMFGLPYRYGLPPVERSTDGAIDTVLLRAALVPRFAAVVPDLFVVQIEAGPDRLRGRLEARGGGPTDLAARLRHDATELAAGRDLADRVLVNDGSVEDLAAGVAGSLPVAA